MELKLDSNEPIYIQIKHLLEMRILCGELKGGEKVPSVRELASDAKVNPNTIVKAYNELEKDELITTKRGIGKFVTEDIEKVNGLKVKVSKDKFYEFIKTVKKFGFSKEEILGIINEMYEEV
ncbi:Hypothetical protein CM240_3301 [Clostridium bornimense]|uniref:HTH gntR-type domain-containing protein n=1 Tax=Clostridium bornimense TaxID=1216932 RepID=W6S123_9CLOT|nr:GntR family transcriptional regulator [Clostridium bornimense]CDM70418.1 Hypothetical protein CM240_3301 [Clostridium bornimense]